MPIIDVCMEKWGWYLGCKRKIASGLRRGLAVVGKKRLRRPDCKYYKSITQRKRVPVNTWMGPQAAGVARLLYGAIGRVWWWCKKTFILFLTSPIRLRTIFHHIARTCVNCTCTASGVTDTSYKDSFLSHCSTIKKKTSESCHLSIIANYGLFRWPYHIIKGLMSRNTLNRA